MDILVLVGGGIVLLAVLASQMLIFPAMWRGLRPLWLRTPLERRGRAIAGGVLSGVHGVVLVALVIAAPWGRYSWAYVLGTDLGAVLLLLFASVAVQAVRQHRRAKGVV